MLVSREHVISKRSDVSGLGYFRQIMSFRPTSLLLFYLFLFSFRLSFSQISSIDYQEDENYSDEEKMKIEEIKPETEFKEPEVLTYYRPSFNQYRIEIVIMTFFIVYLLNFFVARLINYRVMLGWIEDNFDTISQYFSIVGNSTGNDASLERYSVMDPSRYVLWCTGEEQSRGMLFDFNLLPRGDLFHCIWKKIHATNDNLEITLVLDPAEVENINLFIGRKSFWASGAEEFDCMKPHTREYGDLKPSGFPDHMIVMSESQEAVKFIFSSPFFNELSKFYKIFNYISFSDLSKETTLTNQDKSITAHYLVKLSIDLTETSSIWGLKFVNLSSIIHNFLEMMKKIKSFRLSKEAKAMMEKRRTKLAEEKFKANHQQRQEAAMQKKDEKIRALKKRIAEETDAEKQIKLKEKLEKQEARQKLKKISKSKATRVMM